MQSPTWIAQVYVIGDHRAVMSLMMINILEDICFANCVCFATHTNQKNQQQEQQHFTFVVHYNYSLYVTILYHLRAVLFTERISKK